MLKHLNLYIAIMIAVVFLLAANLTNAAEKTYRVEDFLRSPLTLVSIKDWKISVTAELKNGKKVSAKFNIPRPQNIIIKDKPFKSLPVFVDGKLWCVNGRSVPDCAPKSLVAKSLKIASENNGTRIEFSEGADFGCAPYWARFGRKEQGRIDKDTPVLVSYEISPQRLDSIVYSNGQLEYVTGVPTTLEPVPPVLENGQIRLANIYLQTLARKLKKENFFPIMQSVYLSNEKPCAEKLLPKTMKKLRSGEPLKILAWGDSVTACVYLKKTERWQQQFVKRLKERFPRANIELLTEAWPAHRTCHYLDPALSPEKAASCRYQKTVLDKKPDLIISEFVNDGGLKSPDFEKYYEKILKDIKDMDAEWIAIAPHPVLGTYGGPGASTQNKLKPEPREYIKLLKSFAVANSIACADVSDRYANLWKMGIPFLTLMNNHNNHPNGEGLSIYADALMALFPDKP